MLSPAKPDLPSKTPSRFRSASVSGLQIAVLFGAFTLLISIPIWTHPVPPLSDYVNHLARMQVIATLAKNPQLAQFYEINWQVIPNLTMDLIVPPIARVMNIYLAGQAFIVAMFALIISGVLMLNRALIGRWSVLPLFAIPLLYNYIFLVGLMNYIFGIGVALWALAGWVAARERTLAAALCAVDAVRRGAVLLPSLGARHLRHRHPVVRNIPAVDAARRTMAAPALPNSSPADCRSSPSRRCSTPARP